MRRFFTDVALSALVLVIQTTVVARLSIGSIVPDAVIVWIVYLAIARGQMSATTAGFGLGLLQDILSGSDGMLGLTALAKTITGFLLGYTYNENKIHQTLAGVAFPVMVGVGSLVHYLIYFLIFLQGTEISWNDALIQYGLASAFATTLVSVVPALIFRRKYRV